MININTDRLCKQAELYYYNILSDKGDKPVPASVMEHVGHCHNCQVQLKRLEAALSQAYSADSEQGGSDSATAAILQLHFAHTSRLVTCETTKPFLPTLLHPALRVAIPTPITVHLDNCESCSEDLKRIQRMDLSPKQLGRLSQLFADNPTEDTVSCSEAQAAAGLSGVLLAPGKCNAAVLRHLCTCGDCRKAVYQYRESLREDLSRKGTGQSKFPCQEIPARDIFDYCVPYGIDPTADQYARFRESSASHLLSCPACLGRIQELHNAVYGIAERPDSEVATTYYIAEPGEAQTPAASDDVYAGYPIRVEVTNAGDQAKSEKPTLAGGLATALRRRVSTIRFRPFAKIAVVAAVVLIVATLFFNTPSAKGITLAEIYRALENVRNVYIGHFVSGRKEPIQEQWVSRELGFYLIKTERESVLRDVSSGTMKTRRSGDSSTEIRSMSTEMISEARKRMAGSFGLVPFTELSRLPQGSQWGPADSNELSTVAEGIEVYDLSWTQEVPNGPAMMRKWRFFLDRQTGLPQRVELYRKSVDDAKYELKFVKIVEYLSDKQIQEAVNKRFPTSEVSLGQPEGMSVLVSVAAFDDQ